MKSRFLVIFFIAVAFASKAQTVTITSSASGTVCSGTSVTFTATVTSISSPTFQWYKNGTAITGATSSTYSTTTLSNNDQINIRATPAIVSATTVTSNLIANLDAGNSSSYNGTGNTWTDLTGNGNNVTLSNTGYSTVNGGGIALNTNGYGTQTLASPPFNSDFTWSTIFRFNDGMWDWLYNVGGYNGLILTVPGKPGFSWGGWYNNKIDANAESSLTNGNYYMLTFVRSGNAISCYLQASPYGVGSSVSGNISLVSPLIGKAPDGSAPWPNGIVNLILLYNRALTQSEIIQNYNTYASRFGFSAAAISSNTITATIAATPNASVTVTGDACVNKTTLTTTSSLTAYAWYKDNVVISGATSNVYTPTANGVYKVEVTSGSCSNTSTTTTIYNCGVTSDGSMVSISNINSLISPEGGANFGTGRDYSGKLYNTTSLTTASGTIGSSTAVLGGVISATNGVASSVGVVYSTASNFGTYSTTTIGSNVTAGTYTSSITGLTASTNYYAKSFIVNGAGTTYGDVVNFTTTSPPPTPASFSFSNNNLSGNLPNYYLATSNLTLSQLPTSWTIQWTHRTDESTGNNGADGMHWFFLNPSTTGKYSTDMHLYQINGSLQFWYNNNYTNTDPIMTGLTQSTIYKLALTYDGTNLRTYSNGTLISTKAINITVKPTNSTLRMGSNVARTVDEFRIWDSALSAAQISANQGSSVIGSPGLMLYYNFNNGTPGANNTAITTVADQSGNNRNGTFYNTALTGTSNNFVTSIVSGF